MVLTRIKLLNIFQFILGIAIFIVLIRFAGAESTLKTLTSCKILPALYALLFILVNIFAGAIGVTIIGRRFSSKLSWWDGIKGYLTVSLMGLFVPGKLADFSLPAFWRNKLAIHQTSSVVVIDKAITLFWVAGLSLVGVTFFFNKHLVCLLLIFAIILVCIIGFFLMQKKITHHYAVYLPKKVYTFFLGMRDAFSYSLQYARYELLSNILLTGLRMLISGVVLVLLMASVHEDVNVWSMTILNAVSQLSSFIPVTVSGIGVMEFIWVAGFHKIHISADSVIAAAILGRLLVLFISLVFWIILFKKTKT